MSSYMSITANMLRTTEDQSKSEILAFVNNWGNQALRLVLI